MSRYFLGMAAGYSTKQVWRHTFALGRKKDCDNLVDYLGKRYGGEAILCKNGRSALALALKAYFEPGDAVLVNGFTCYAVYEAVKAAGLRPIWVDISRSDSGTELNASFASSLAPVWGDRAASLERPSEPGLCSLRCPVVTGLASSIAPVVANAHESSSSRTQIRGIIIQNTLGNPVDIAAVEEFAREHGLTIIEDLAHSAGVKYADGREAGTVGAGVAFSFGKDKMIDTVSGGAVVLRDPCKRTIKAPTKLPKPSDALRARFYPFFGTICRGLTSVRLGGVLMRSLVKIHWVEKSADNKLDLTRKISKFEAKLALEQFKKLKRAGEPPLREFYLVEDRGEALAELRRAGYYFDGFWYERPVSPARYYKKVHFPEAECPEATFVAEHIVNLPTYYSKRDLAPARKIIERHLIREAKDEDRK